ncbi:MAG: transcription-repair coupling factor, partial [Cellulomonadaceae bacterium]|nr:transcription-repair coupling factor [Cellulomonadaceae bacterium]
MSLLGVTAALRQEPGFERALEQSKARGEFELVATPGVRPALLVDLAQQRPLVVVTATGRGADEMASALQAYLPTAQHDSVAVLPAWETLPHERLSPRPDTSARRLAVFRRLAHPEGDGPTGPIQILVVPVRSLLQPVVVGLGDLEPIVLRTGDTADLTEVAQRLTSAAYQRVDMVERRGEFAVRGGILDIFPPTESHPLRIEFWGDEVSEIRWFSVADQRSLEVAVHGLWATPCRELLLTPAVRERAAALVNKLSGAGSSETIALLERIAGGIATEGMESLIPVLADGLTAVLELVAGNALLVVDDPEKVRRRAHDLVATTSEFLAAAWSGAVSGGSTPLNLESASFITLDEAQAVAERRGLGWWTLGSFGLDHGLSDNTDPDSPGGDHNPEWSGDVVINAQAVATYRGEVDRALQDLRAMQRDQWRIVLTTEGSGSAKRMVEQLGAVECAARLVTDLAGEIEPGVVQVIPGHVGHGFLAPNLRLAVFSEADLTGRKGTNTRDMRKLPSRRRNVVDPLQLKAGDYVVHEQHGVGRFIEMVQRTMGAGATAHTRE